MPTTRDIGNEAEDQAETFLRNCGWEILERNWSYKHVGEIDIIAKDGDTVVFVEVRYRTRAQFGMPESTITRAKIGRLRRTATLWLVKHGLTNAPCRMDVIGMDMIQGNIEIRHLRNAM